MFFQTEMENQLEENFWIGFKVQIVNTDASDDRKYNNMTNNIMSCNHLTLSTHECGNSKNEFIETGNMK